MSLSAEDFWTIRDIFKDEAREMFHTEGRVIMRDIIQKDLREIVHDAVNFELTDLKGRVTAVENDVKEIYFILTRLDRRVARFDKKLSGLGTRVTKLEAANNG